MESRIYLDNAATTPLDPRVLEAMLPYLTERFGNPSSIYSYGRESRLAVESARKKVAQILGAHPGEIFFTSGGTESSNTAILAAVRDLGCTRILSSPLEHHATLHTIEFLRRSGQAEVQFLSVLPDGHLDLDGLERMLGQTNGKTLVTLMHANNEIGNLLDIDRVAQLCLKKGAIFHSDTVQTVGHLPIDLKKIPVHFITGAGHKFHGPKGVGILFVRDNVKIQPHIHGGSQERNLRAGTENLYGIVGFAKALEIANANLDEDARTVGQIKGYMHQQLLKKIPGVTFNGDPLGRSLYTILSVGLPKTEKSDMVLFNLDIHHVCASGGSACTSGVEQSSHVIQAIPGAPPQVTVRFSFSRQNTFSEIDAAVEQLSGLL